MDKKAFVFSLDAFVAFTLIIASLYTLVFFSTVPSAYYSALMQANFLAKDSMLSLSTTEYGDGQTYLDYILEELRGGNEGPTRLYLGALIPTQFGYSLATCDTPEGCGTEGWNVLYDTAEDESPDNRHKRAYDKLRATAQSLYIVVDAARDKGESPYGYITCRGNYTVCDLPLPYEYEEGEVSLKLVRLAVYT